MFLGSHLHFLNVILIQVKVLLPPLWRPCPLDFLLSDTSLCVEHFSLERHTGHKEDYLKKNQIKRGFPGFLFAEHKL